MLGCASADTGNAKVDQAMVRAYLEQRLGFAEGEFFRGKKLDGVAEAVVKNFDKDGDGKLSWPEFQGFESQIAGLLAPDAGQIRLDDAPVTEPGPDRGIVFQQYSLLPWLSVRGNVALAVDAVNPTLPAATRRRLTDELIALVNLSPGAWKRPRELSGGMRQRVAVARGLAMQPKLLLMDEPFSALDALTRATLQDELLRIWSERRTTVMLITNDVDEAILLADRIYPMTPGPDAVLGPPIEVGLPRPRQRRHMSLEPAYQKARQALVEFLRARRP